MRTPEHNVLLLFLLIPVDVFCLIWFHWQRAWITGILKTSELWINGLWINTYCRSFTPQIITVVILPMMQADIACKDQHWRPLKASPGVRRHRKESSNRRLKHRVQTTKGNRQGKNQNHKTSISRGNERVLFWTSWEEKWKLIFCSGKKNSGSCRRQYFSLQGNLFKKQQKTSFSKSSKRKSSC